MKDAASRITTIAQVHDHLWRSSKIGFVDIADFAGELCRKLQETVAHKISCAFDPLMISADKAIPLGLLINEIVTNSAKHTYPLSPAASAKFRQTAATQLEAIELGWPNEDPAFRQLFTSMLIPDATADQFARSMNRSA